MTAYQAYQNDHDIVNLENNLYQTAKRFSLNTKTIGRWVADIEKIKKSKKASKRVAHG